MKLNRKSILRNNILAVSLVINLFFIAALMYSFKMKNKPTTELNYFIAEYTVGNGWKANKNFSEQTYSGQHSRFLASLIKEGIIELGGRYSDKGIIIFKSQGLNNAKELLESDTAVVHNLFKVEVNELKLFYQGKTQAQNQNQEKMKNKKVTGIGGIFFKCKDPDKMKAWYNTHLGIDTDQYGTSFEWRQGAEPEKKGFTQWSPFAEKTTYFEPSGKDFMINYRVENLEALVKELEKEGVTILDKIETFEYGKFVHIMDVEENKIELWEPNDEEYDKIVEGRTK